MTNLDIMKAIKMVTTYYKKDTPALIKRLEMVTWMYDWLEQNGDALGILEMDDRSMVIATLLKGMFMDSKTPDKFCAMIKSEFGLNTSLLIQYANLSAKELVEEKDHAAMLVKLAEGNVLDNLKDDERTIMNREIFSKLIGCDLSGDEDSK